MKSIALTRGFEALVDDDDFARVVEHKWQPQVVGGRVHSVQRIVYLGGGKYNQKRRRESLHRFILGVTDPAVVVDHRDGNPLNNSRANLRLATRAQNSANLTAYLKRKNERGGFLGVTYCKRTGRWAAAIHVGRRYVWLGRHDTAEQAARARDEAAFAAWGEFAALNFPRVLAMPVSAGGAS